MGRIFGVFIASCFSLVTGVRLELQSGNGDGKARVSINGQVVLLGNHDVLWPAEWGPIAGNTQLWNQTTRVGHYFAMATTQDARYPKGFKLGIFPVISPCSTFLDGIKRFIDSVEVEGVVTVGTEFKGNLACKDWVYCGDTHKKYNVCTENQNRELWTILQRLGSTIPPNGPGLRSGDKYLLLGPKCPQVHNGAMVERFTTIYNPRMLAGEPSGGWTWNGPVDFDNGRFWTSPGQVMTPVIFQLNANPGFRRCEQTTPFFFVFIITVCMTFLIPCGILVYYRRFILGGQFSKNQWGVEKNDIGKLIRKQEKKDFKRRKELTTDIGQDILLFPPYTPDLDGDIPCEVDSLRVWHNHGSNMQKHGPCSATEMRELVSQGRVQATTKIEEIPSSYQAATASYSESKSRARGEKLHPSSISLYDTSCTGYPQVPRRPSDHPRILDWPCSYKERSGRQMGPASQHMGSQPSQNMRSHPSQHVASHPSQLMGSHPSQHMRSHPSQHRGSHPSQYMGSYPSQHMRSHSSQHMASHPSQHMRSHSSQHMASHPSQHMRFHPSQHMRSHPSQHMGSHPSQHMSTASQQERYYPA